MPREDQVSNEFNREDEVVLAREKVRRIVAELADEFEDFNWWMPEDMAFLREGLERELPTGHPLSGHDLVPMAESERNDDVLFYDGEKFVVVHLTWSQDNALPFPLFKEIEGNDIGKFLRSDYLDG